MKIDSKTQATGASGVTLDIARSRGSVKWSGLRDFTFEKVI